MVLPPEEEVQWWTGLLLRQAHRGRYSLRGRYVNTLLTISRKTLRIYPLALLDHVEPFNATATTPAPSSAGFSQGPQSAYSDSSGRPLDPSFGQTVTDPSRYSQSGRLSETGQTYVSGSSGQPRVGKAALIAQQNQGTQQPVQYQDSGIRFNENGEQEAGPSHLPTEVPPTYTPN